MRVNDMKSKPPSEAFKVIVRDQVVAALQALGMCMYTFEVSYKKEDLHDSDRGRVTWADIRVDRRYLRANVNVYPVLIREWETKMIDEERLREILTHEVAHISTQHLYDVGRARYCDDGEMMDAWEALTSMVAELIVFKVNTQRKKAKDDVK